MTDPIRAALERLIARLDETTDPNGPVPAWSDSFYAAQAALSADGPAVAEGREPAAVVGEPSDEELDVLANELLDCTPEGIRAFARAALARYGHQPAPPAEGEDADEARYLVTELRDQADDMSPSLELFGLIHRAADLLERLASPACVVLKPSPELIEAFKGLPPGRIEPLLAQRHPEPVPVAERLPGPEDCDAKGRVWWGAPALSGTVTGSVPHSWRLCRPEDRFGSELVWLPAAALPLPAGEVQP